MEASVTLPRGLTSRALTVDDVDDVIALVNTCERHDAGFEMWEREDLTSDFRLPGVDVTVDTVGIRDGDRLVGWGFLPNDRGGWVDVHPDARGRGTGTWLRVWTEHRARAKGAPRVGQTINDRATDAVQLLVEAGYKPGHTSWILSTEHPERPADPSPPEGVTIRAYRPEDDEEALGMFEAAFAEAPDRTPSSLAAWRVMVTERDGFTPEALMIAEHEGEIVGGAFLIDAEEIWVDKFAVRRDHRHRGIARALLQVTFQRSFDRGYARTSLSTDSDRSAITFYEKIGMRIRESYTHHSIDI